MISDWDELEFFHSNKFRKILKMIHEENKKGNVILPPRDEILNAFVYTSLDNVKVIIFGQDPYHQVNPQYAHGLAFSSRLGSVPPLPKSLVNIFRELKDDTGLIRENGDLSDWARQGVLLLNTALTVIAGLAGSHSGIGWTGLIRDVITCVNEQKEHVVFILWGKHAQQYEVFIDKNKHNVIKSAHPSPLSAPRGFFGSKPFSKTNIYLISHDIKPIQW